jgi:ATP-binding cassette subfamily B protein
MNLLYRYSKQYWKLFVAALLLAATNQIFSLLDPLIFRHVIDSYATKYHQYTQGQFIRGAGLLLLAAVGVAFVSRVAKNFQDYFVNVIVQRLGAKMYSDGIRHSLDLPYQVFEDQRSGETLGKLQKVRSDVERFITAAINVLFISVVGIVFVMIYAFRVHWAIAPAFLITVPLLGIISSVLSKRIKKMQKTIVAETTALAGSTTESLRNIELVKSLGLAHQEVPAQPEFRPGDGRQRTSHQHFVFDAVFDFSPADHNRAIFLSDDLFVFHFHTVAGIGERHQHLS